MIELKNDVNDAKFGSGESCLVAESCATISARDVTSSLRGIRFKACFAEFSLIQSLFPFSALVRPKATNCAIWSCKVKVWELYTKALHPLSLSSANDLELG